METAPTVENIVTRFDAHTVTHRLDVVDRHAEDGRLYAILKDDDCTREEPVDVVPFADVQVGPNCEFGRRIAAVAVEYGPATVTVTRPYSEGEADGLL